MPEKTGTVTGLIKKRDGTVFGLNIDGDEYLYSFPDKRAEPWDSHEVGDVVRVEYSPYEKDGKTKQYLAVIENLKGSAGLEMPDDALPASSNVPDQAWSYEKKDKLMCRESCAKSAVAIFAASIQAGIYKTHPDVTAVIAYAAALEAWCLEALD